ncbi:hypothetical protein [Desulfovibrio sp.]|uniref:hypothetical protein n=1 Tax=Desulfovibrio sp. TaxID=885 RepID=UPI0025C3B225|nr:hypothetical protein [Desulfovibrio sp.]
MKLNISACARKWFSTGLNGPQYLGGRMQRSDSWHCNSSGQANLFFARRICLDRYNEGSYELKTQELFPAKLPAKAKKL